MTTEMTKTTTVTKTTVEKETTLDEQTMIPLEADVIAQGPKFMSCSHCQELCQHLLAVS